MKIAYVGDVVYPFTKGGSEKRIYEISKYLVSKGHEVHIFGINWWNGSSVLEKDGIIYHGVSRSPKSLFVSSRRSIKEAVYFSLNLFPALIKLRFDIIHCLQSPMLHIYVSKCLSLKMRSTLVLDYYEVWNNYWYSYMGSLGGIGQFIEGNILKIKDNTIITISEYTKNQLIEMGSSPESITVVPNGVDFSLIQEAPISENRTDVVFVGRLIRAKRVDLLIKAIPFVKEHFPSVKIGLIGDGPEKSFLQKLAAELDVKDNVIFFERKESFIETISILKASQLFVYPTAPEGGGSLSMFEANACGIPTIALKDGPLGTGTEVIKDGYNGLLVKTATPKSVAEAICYLLCDDKKRGVMAMNAKNFAESYDWARISERVEKLYYEIRAK